MYATRNLNWLNGMNIRKWKSLSIESNPIDERDINMKFSASYMQRAYAHCSLPIAHYKYSRWLFYLNYLMQTHLIELFIGRCAATHRKILKLWIMSQAFAFNQLWMVDEKLIVCVCARLKSHLSKGNAFATSREFDRTSDEIMIFFFVEESQNKSIKTIVFFMAIVG